VGALDHQWNLELKLSLITLKLIMHGSVGFKYQLASFGMHERVNLVAPVSGKLYWFFQSALSE